MANFLEKFAGGFAKVGSTILAEKQKQDDEVNAYMKKYAWQKRMDVDAEKELEEYKQEKFKKRTAEDIAKLNSLFINGQISDDTINQGQAALTGGEDFNQLPEPTVTMDESPMDMAEVASTPQAIMPTAQPSMPSPNLQRVSKEDVLTEYYQLDEKTILGSPNAMLIALAKAEEKARKRGSQAIRDIAAASREELDLDTGSKLNYWSQNQQEIADRAARVGLPFEEDAIDENAKGFTPKEWKERGFKNAEAFSSDGYRQDFATIRDAEYRFKDMLQRAGVADTGYIQGTSFGKELKLLAEDKNFITLASQIAAGLASVPRTPGSVSNFEAENLAKALATLRNSPEVNVEILSSLLQSIDRVKQSMIFEQEMQSTFTHPNRAFVQRKFDEYIKANPMFVNGKDGSLIENKTRLTTSQYFKQGQSTPTQESINTEQQSNISSEVDAIASKYGF